MRRHISTVVCWINESPTTVSWKLPIVSKNYIGFLRFPGPSFDREHFEKGGVKNSSEEDVKLSRKQSANRRQVDARSGFCDVNRQCRRFPGKKGEGIQHLSYLVQISCGHGCPRVKNSLSSSPELQETHILVWRTSAIVGVDIHESLARKVLGKPCGKTFGLILWPPTLSMIIPKI